MDRIKTKLTNFARYEIWNWVLKFQPMDCLFCVIIGSLIGTLDSWVFVVPLLPWPSSVWCCLTYRLHSCVPAFSAQGDPDVEVVLLESFGERLWVIREHSIIIWQKIGKQICEKFLNQFILAIKESASVCPFDCPRHGKLFLFCSHKIFFICKQ